jgi:hypothetical protein
MTPVRWLGLLGLAAAAACGGKDDSAPARAPRVTGTGGSVLEIGGAGGQMNSGACAEDMKANCRVVYGVYENQLSCFEGVQLCHCGQWGPCVEEAELYNVGGTCGAGGAAGIAGEGGEVGSGGAGGAS